MSKLSSNDYLTLAGSFHGYVVKVSAQSGAHDTHGTQHACHYRPPLPSSSSSEPPSLLQRAVTLYKSPNRSRSPGIEPLPHPMFSDTDGDQVPSLHGAPATQCGHNDKEDLRAVCRLRDEESFLHGGDAHKMREVRSRTRWICEGQRVKS